MRKKRVYLGVKFNQKIFVTVEEMKELMKTMSQTEIAQRLNVTRQAVSYFIKMKINKPKKEKDWADWVITDPETISS